MAFRVLRSRKEFEYWLTKAVTGDVAVYHIGDLAYDRLGQSPTAKMVNDMGDVAYEFSRSQELHLLQKRLEKNVFEYRAVKTLPRNIDRMNRQLRKPIPAGQIDGRITPSMAPVASLVAA